MKTNLPVTANAPLVSMHRYLVSNPDLKGSVTCANDTCVELSKFSRYELIGSSRNLVRQPDMLAEAFVDQWRTGKIALPWYGIVKNLCVDEQVKRGGGNELLIIAGSLNTLKNDC